MPANLNKEMNIPVTIIGLDLDENLQEVRYENVCVAYSYLEPTVAFFSNIMWLNISIICHLRYSIITIMMKDENLLTIGLFIQNLISE